VNRYVTEETIPVEILEINEEVEEKQLAKLKEVKRTRDSRRVIQRLSDLRAASKSDRNLMPYVIDAVKAYATEQEICDVWRDVFGEYRESVVRL